MAHWFLSTKKQFFGRKQEEKCGNIYSSRSSSESEGDAPQNADISGES